MSKVVLDAVGGDFAPDAAIDGAALSVERGILRAQDIALSGPRGLIEETLAGRGLEPDTFVVLDAPDVLTKDDQPVEALRRKPRNSIATGIRAVKEGQAEAFVSAGSTGTVVAAATVGLRCLEGIRRPGIAVVIHGQKGPFMVIDVGANSQPKAQHLLHYALMGTAYYHDTFGAETPRVGLMNIGSEDEKGNPLTKEARALLRAAPIHFVGNVEGSDIFSGACDVVVADGFTGNVLLKVSEGCAEYMLQSMAGMMQEAGVDPGRIGTVVGRMKKRVDYSEFGGALLLGVSGIVTICHGRSQGPAICNAIRFAAKAVGARVNEHIVAAARAASSPS